MLYLSGVRRPEMAAMLTPRMGQRPFEGQTWAADNGRFGSPQDYSDEKYLRWLRGMPVETCLFATAPDVVGDAAGTLELSTPMLAPIRALGYPVAFVAQDGIERTDVPWDAFDCLFVGGTTEFKLGTVAVTVVAEAKRRGKWVHMGRVNSLRRLAYAEAIGCDSADGTVLKHDPNRDVAGWQRHVNTNPSLWRTVA